MDQAIPTVGAGIPSIIANLYFRAFRFNNAFGIGGQFLDLIDVAVFFTQLSKLLFVSAPSPTIKDDDQQYASQPGQHASRQRRPLTVFFTNRLKHHSRKCNNERDGQQLNERISLSRRTARREEASPGKRAVLISHLVLSFSI